MIEILLNLIITKSIFSYRCKLIPENNNCTKLLPGKYYVPDAVDNSIFDFIGRTNLLESITEYRACAVLYDAITCFYKYPPCDTNNSLILPVCIERCGEIHKIIEICGELINVMIKFNCSIPETYFSSNLRFSTTSCSKLLILSRIQLYENHYI